MQGWIVFIFVFLSLGCSLLQKKKWSQEDSLQPSRLDRYEDDLGLENFDQALLTQIEDLKKRPQAYPAKFRFGPKESNKEDYLAALQNLRLVVGQAADTKTVSAYIRDHFDCFDVAGEGQSGQVFLTSYFHPIIKASKKPTALHSRPLYRVPQDLVTIAANEWMPPLKEEGSLRGRLVREEQKIKIRPYWSRAEIDSLESLKGQKLEIAYADPIDIFILQIQGSGTLDLGGGQKIKAGYADQNGYPYVAIGQFLKDRIPLEKMNLASIENLLRSMPASEAQSIMNENQSYIFFQTRSDQPLTTIGLPPQQGRTVAVDSRYFPKGALAYLRFQKPVFESAQAEAPKAWLPSSRFVFDHDTGGAIRGTARADLYWGEGEEAKRAAGQIKQWGQLCYLVPK